MRKRRYSSTRFFFPTADFIFYAPFDRNVHDQGRSKLTGSIAQPQGNRIVLSNPIKGGLGTPNKPVHGYSGTMVTDNYIAYGANSINGQFDYTFGVWACLRAFGNYKYLVCHDPSTNNAVSHSMQLLANAAGSIIFRRNANNDVTYPIELNKWYFYTFVYTHSNATSKYYVNGKYIGSWTGTHSYDSTAGRNFFINCKTNNGSVVYEWDGQWSEVFCIKGALSPSAILSYYKYMLSDEINVPVALASLNDPWAGAYAYTPAFIEGDGIAVYQKAYLWQMEYVACTTPAYLRAEDANLVTVFDYESFEYHTTIPSFQDILYETFEPLATVSVGISAFIDVSAIVDTSIPADVCGFEAITSSSLAAIEGYRPDTNPIISSPGFVWGIGTKVLSSPSYIFGMVKPVVDTPSFVHGIDAVVADGVPGYVEGVEIAMASTDATVWGITSITGGSPASVHGLNTITSGSTAYTIGYIEVSADGVGGYVCGSDAPVGSVRSYLIGYDTIQVGISGWVDTAIAINTSIPSHVDTSIQIVPATIGTHLHIVDYSDISNVAYTIGMQFISGGLKAHSHDYYDLFRSSLSYVKPYDRITSGMHAIIPDIIDYANGYQKAWVFGISGTLTPSITGYLEGYDLGSINSLAYVDTSLVVTGGMSSYINPIKLDHRISTPAYLSVDTHIGNGLTGFAHYDDVVMVDSSYNRVSTLICDYYSGSGNVVFNTFLVNGKRYNVYDIRMRTNSTWSGKIKILHGAVEPYLTDNWNTTYAIPGPINPDCAISTRITVVNPGVTGTVIIPIEITHSNIV